MNQLGGIEVSVEVVDDPALIARVTQGGYQMAMWGFPWLNADPGLCNALHSDLVTNYSRYSNPDVDKALDAARVSTDDAERLDLYWAVYEIIAEDLPYLPFRTPTTARCSPRTSLAGRSTRTASSAST